MLHILVYLKLSPCFFFLENKIPYKVPVKKSVIGLFGLAYYDDYEFRVKFGLKVYD